MDLSFWYNPASFYVLFGLGLAIMILLTSFIYACVRV